MGKQGIITFIATAIASAVISIPSWLPVFGVEYADFGAALMATFFGFLPVITAAMGFLVGWCVRKRVNKRAGEDEPSVAVSEPAVPMHIENNPTVNVSVSDGMKKDDLEDYLKERERKEARARRIEERS